MRVEKRWPGRWDKVNGLIRKGWTYHLKPSEQLTAVRFPNKDHPLRVEGILFDGDKVTVRVKNPRVHPTELAGFVVIEVLVKEEEIKR